MKKLILKSKAYLPIIEDEQDFYVGINKALETSTHKHGLKQIIEEFEMYKNFMLGTIISVSVPSDEIYKFKLTYQRKNKVWREYEIFADQPLELLAEDIIDSMGWSNDHLDAFFFPEKRGKTIFSHWYTPFEIGSNGVDNDQFPIMHTNEVFVGNINYIKYPKLGFVFDFGDDHRFLMEYKGKRKATKYDDKDVYPKLVDQRGVGPEQYPKYFEEDHEHVGDVTEMVELEDLSRVEHIKESKKRIKKINKKSNKLK